MFLPPKAGIIGRRASAVRVAFLYAGDFIGMPFVL